MTQISKENVQPVENLKDTDLVDGPALKIGQLQTQALQALPVRVQEILDQDPETAKIQ